MESNSGYNIPIAKPYFSGEEAGLVAEVIKSGWLVQGPMVAKFEKLVAERTGAKFAVATSSCTTALHLAMLVNKIGAGDDVICPSYSMIATANAITYSGAKPQFVDIDPHTLNIDPSATERFIDSNYTSDMLHRQAGSKLKGILIVHQIGIPADIDKFESICKSRGLVLMEDSACALGSAYKKKPIGASGHANTLSFHPRKLITCGEGGMLLLNDETMADASRVLRAHGMSVSDFARHQSASSVYETYDVVGYNYRMTDMQAAVGIKQLELLDWIIDKRQDVATIYNKAFGALEQMEIIVPPDYVSVWNYQSYPVRLKKGGRKERDAFMQKLQAAGVTTRRGIPPIHKESIYDSGLSLAHTESVSERSLFLPIFPQLTEDEIQHIVKSVSACAAELASPVHV